MERKFEVVENERQSFLAPVEIRWTAPEGTMHCSSGQTVDASIYDLGVVVEKQIPGSTDLRVQIADTLLCGMGNVRYSHPVLKGFKVGLQFQTTLVMQGIPDLDAVLMRSLKPRAKGRLRRVGHLRSI
jgi:hypothetical protein